MPAWSGTGSRSLQSIVDQHRSRCCRRCSHRHWTEHVAFGKIDNMDCGPISLGLRRHPLARRISLRSRTETF
jgi:hypothetical protein